MSETPELAPCPFCGGNAEVVNIEQGENAGGSYVACTVCLASSNVEFEFKENFIDNWNRRASPAYDPATLEAAAGLVENSEWLPPGGAPFAGSLAIASEVSKHCQDIAAQIRALAKENDHGSV